MDTCLRSEARQNETHNAKSSECGKSIFAVRNMEVPRIHVPWSAVHPEVPTLYAEVFGGNPQPYALAGRSINWAGSSFRPGVIHGTLESTSFRLAPRKGKIAF